MKLSFCLDGKQFVSEIEFKSDDVYLVKVSGKSYRIKKFRTCLGVLLKEGETFFEVAVKPSGLGEFDVYVNNEPHRVSLKTSMQAIKSKSLDRKQAKIEKEVFSPLFGVVGRIFSEANQSVKKGQKLLSITSMKMENLVLVPNNGIVAKIFVEKGQRVAEGQLLVRFR